MNVSAPTKQFGTAVPAAERVDSHYNVINRSDLFQICKQKKNQRLIKEAKVIAAAEKREINQARKIEEERIKDLVDRNDLIRCKCKKHCDS